MGCILPADQTAPGTPPTTVSRRNTPMPEGSSEEISLSTFNAPSLGGDTESFLEEEWSLCVDVDLSREMLGGDASSGA